MIIKIFCFFLVKNFSFTIYLLSNYVAAVSIVFENLLRHRFKKAGKSERRAKIMRSKKLIAEDPLLYAILLRVLAAWIWRKDGGATPKKVPQKNASKGTSIKGETIFITQFGMIGVIRRKRI